jgi:predicted metal-dependent hydrolase
MRKTNRLRQGLIAAHSLFDEYEKAGPSGSEPASWVSLEQRAQGFCWGGSLR